MVTDQAWQPVILSGNETDTHDFQYTYASQADCLSLLMCDHFSGSATVPLACGSLLGEHVILHRSGPQLSLLLTNVLAPMQTFCRKFLWHELMLWPEDMPPHALVILSDADDLVPSALVAKHISDAHTTATVMYHPTAGHGGFLVDLPWQRQMVQVSATSSPLGHAYGHLLPLNADKTNRGSLALMRRSR